jgi:hypothetical protein
VVGFKAHQAIIAGGESDRYIDGNEMSRHDG